jgi:hypothetical protein
VRKNAQRTVGENLGQQVANVSDEKGHSCVETFIGVEVEFGVK